MTLILLILSYEVILGVKDYYFYYNEIFLVIGEYKMVGELLVIMFFFMVGIRRKRRCFFDCNRGCKKWSLLFYVLIN